MKVASVTDSRVSPTPEATGSRPIYLDCNATTPVDPRVSAEVLEFMAREYGNAGSRTHSYGQLAKERVGRARVEVASVVDAKPDEVIFTSGATESNNLAILGLAAHGDRTERRHVVASKIEHKAVLEPLDALAARGFEVTLLAPTPGGWVDPEALRDALRPDTLLVSIMAANNETGVVQPVDELADVIADHEAYFHVDGAQAFGRLIQPLRNQRIDLLSISGHKIYAPKGIGALINRRRCYARAPLRPLMFGGGQERGLRPGTLPVPLIAGLGLASSIALKEHEHRAKRCRDIRASALSKLAGLGIVMNGDPNRSMPHTINFTVPGIDSEAAIVVLKDLVAISNGSACTSQTYTPSHVLIAAGLPGEQVTGALRVSWSYLTPDAPWDQVAHRLAELRRR